MRESPMSDEGWPKRKRSDLMAHMTPNHGIRIGLNKKIKMFFGLKGIFIEPSLQFKKIYIKL